MLRSLGSRRRRPSQWTPSNDFCSSALSRLLRMPVFQSTRLLAKTLVYLLEVLFRSMSLIYLEIPIRFPCIKPRVSVSSSPSSSPTLDADHTRLRLCHAIQPDLALLRSQGPEFYSRYCMFIESGGVAFGLPESPNRGINQRPGWGLPPEHVTRILDLILYLPVILQNVQWKNPRGPH